MLFPEHGPEDAARALVKALSMARGVLSDLGSAATGLLQADRANIWASSGAGLEIDAERHEEALRAALAMAPGPGRDDRLLAALAEEGVLLADEPYEDWALRPRERLEDLRQQARLVLARDRAKGAAGSRPDDVVEAWELCLRHDPACEEAAAALIRAYSARGLRHLVLRTYERCRSALEDLGLRPSAALEEVHAGATFEPAQARAVSTPSPAPVSGSSHRRAREERRTVSVLFAEVVTPSEGARADPEDLREVVGETLAGVITEVEGLGGTVTSVSGAGLQALFGAPETHEDDPERALRAAFRALSARAAMAGVGPPAVRIGVETGPAVLGSIVAGTRFEYGAVGAVVGTAAALQSQAKPGSALVGPVTRAAVEGLFQWGTTQEVAASPGAKPVVASYLERPKARPAGQAGRRRLADTAPLVGRDLELSVLRQALREAAAGQGGVVVIAGEPGLGKTRLVHECRKLFMAWAGAASGRLPLWLEARGASYASSTPYGLYQQLLCAWVGVAPEEPENVVSPALERAMKAVFAGKVDDEQVGLLAQVMGLGPGRAGRGLSRLGPDQLQRATFAAMKALVSRLIAHGPTLVVLEDLHWADPTSLGLTQELASLCQPGPAVAGPNPPARARPRCLGPGSRPWC
jgi:class 3 adenylate cyclase